MNGCSSRLPNDYFEKIYADDFDPWGFESRWYEARKYALTVASLPRPRYRRAFEPGCSIGVLTSMLAEHCDALVASDPVPKVAEFARNRMKQSRHVSVRTEAIPETWPEGDFDLIVFSEVAYYLTSAGLTELLARVDDSLLPGGHIVAVHWTGKTDYPLEGREVHRRFDQHPSLVSISTHEEKDFLMNVYERVRRS